MLLSLASLVLLSIGGWSVEQNFFKIKEINVVNINSYFKLLIFAMYRSALLVNCKCSIKNTVEINNNFYKIIFWIFNINIVDNLYDNDGYHFRYADVETQTIDENFINFDKRIIYNRKEGIIFYSVHCIYNFIPLIYMGHLINALYHYKSDNLMYIYIYLVLSFSYINIAYCNKISQEIYLAIKILIARNIHYSNEHFIFRCMVLLMVITYTRINSNVKFSEMSLFHHLILYALTLF